MQNFSLAEKLGDSSYTHTVDAARNQCLGRPLTAELIERKSTAPPKPKAA
jgi:hypothetical protein